MEQLHRIRENTGRRSEEHQAIASILVQGREEKAVEISNLPTEIAVELLWYL